MFMMAFKVHLVNKYSGYILNYASIQVRKNRNNIINS